MTKFTKPITLNGDGKEIILDGIDFTNEAHVTITNASSVTIKNCRIYNITGVGQSDHNFWMYIDTSTMPTVKLVAENNFFGANTSVYNLFELNGYLSMDSSISNNYFTDACCTHNYVGLYGVAEKASIYMNKNHFETSKEGGIRLGMKGSADCNLVFEENTIEKATNQSDQSWEGLLCIQPYGTQTTSFENCSISLINNEIPTDQVAYVYCGASDTKITEETAPKITLNGEVYQCPILTA